MQAIVAVSNNWGIGKDGELLFRISADLKRFKDLTSGHSVIMGRKTLESLPGKKGLPGRKNIVLTGNYALTAPNIETAHFPVQAVFSAGVDTFVIGGESIYRQFLPLCERVFVTKIFASAEADAFFPDLDADSHWQIEHESEMMEENGLRFRFVEYIPREAEDFLPAEPDAAPTLFCPPADFSDFSGI